MNDKEKFEGFLRKMVEDNEQKYGNEIREKYGEDMINNSNAKILSMNLEQYAELEKLTEELNQTLKEAVEQRDPASPWLKELVNCINNGYSFSGISTVKKLK